MALQLQSPPMLYVLDQYSFSDEAANLVVAQNEGTKVAYVDSIKDVWHAIDNGQRGLVPLENSSGGIVQPHFDKWLEGNCTICSETKLQIHMCVGVLPGANIADATTVISHPKGLEQCSKWIAGHPQLTNHVPVTNTAAAARQIRQTGTLEDICLASRRAITAYELDVVAKDVANLPGAGNVTTFVELQKNSRDTLPAPEARYHAALLTPENGLGVLSDVTKIIADARVDLYAIHSRAIAPGTYAFFVQMDKSASTVEEFTAMAHKLETYARMRSVRWLGSYN